MKTPLIRKTKKQLRKCVTSCWLKPLAKYRVLPDFIIIGAQKSGTSSLFGALNGHPEVISPWMKEIHYFDHHYTGNLSDYRAQFPLRFRLNWSQKGRVCGEASPYYLAHPLSRQRINECLGQVKMIVVLRHPLDRAISHYRHNRRVGGVSREPETFAQALKLEKERLAGEEERLLREEIQWSPAHVFYSYRERGNYFAQLQRFKSEFLSGQLHVVFFEELCESPAIELARVFQYLGISTAPDVEFPRLNAGNTTAFDDIEPEAIASLLTQYEASNRQLYDFLGRSCSAWERRDNELTEYLKRV